LFHISFRKMPEKKKETPTSFSQPYRRPGVRSGGCKGFCLPPGAPLRFGWGSAIQPLKGRCLCPFFTNRMQWWYYIPQEKACQSQQIPIYRLLSIPGRGMGNLCRKMANRH